MGKFSLYGRPYSLKRPNPRLEEEVAGLRAVVEALTAALQTVTERQLSVTDRIIENVSELTASVSTMSDNQKEAVALLGRVLSQEERSLALHDAHLDGIEAANERITNTRELLVSTAQSGTKAMVSLAERVTALEKSAGDGDGKGGKWIDRALKAAEVAGNLLGSREALPEGHTPH